MEDYIKIKEDWYGAKKDDILKWAGNNSPMGFPLMQFPKNRISTSASSPYASITGLSYETATVDDWVKQEMDGLKKEGSFKFKIGDQVQIVPGGRECHDTKNNATIAGSIESGSLGTTSIIHDFYQNDSLNWYKIKLIGTNMIYGNAVSEGGLQLVDSKYPLVLSDLKEDEIYVGCGRDEIETFLFKPRKAEISLSDKRYYSGNSPSGSGSKFRIATPDEKKWLEFCIKENKFFSKEVILRKNPHTTYDFQPMGIYVGEWSNGKVLFRTSTGILHEKCELIFDIHKEKPTFEIAIKGCCTAPNIDFREADTVEKEWLLACISKGRFIARDRFPNEDLIPGKWYKCLGNCYFKFKKFSSWNCMDAETIHLTYCSSNSVTNELWWENPTELKDLSEIQGFLPTGHVDKKEFKVGDWVIGWHRDEYLKNQAWQIGRISEKNFVYPIGAELSWNTEMKNIRFATKEEIERVPKKESKLSSLPEKWCIKIINEEICNYVNKNGSYPPYGWPNNKGNYAHFPSIDGLTICDIIESGYTEINYEEFKKWVLNKEKSMNKKEPILVDGEWKPQVGEYVAMVKAGGWGYDPINNGCIAKITKVQLGEAYRFKTYRINGEIINPNNWDKTFFYIPNNPIVTGKHWETS